MTIDVLLLETLTLLLNWKLPATRIITRPLHSSLFPLPSSFLLLPFSFLSTSFTLFHDPQTYLPCSHFESVTYLGVIVTP